MNESPAAGILLVDDRPENLLALEATLSGLSHPLVRAHSGHEALKQVLDREFAVILLDVQMPGLDGYETARLIRSREKDRATPIIFITAIYSTAECVARGYEAGAADYLVKPYPPEVLRAKVEALSAASREARVLRDQLAHARAECDSLREQIERLVTQRDADTQEHERQWRSCVSLLGHELRNPLSPIVASADLLKLRLSADPKAQHAREVILRNARRMADTFRRLEQSCRFAFGHLDLSPRPLDLVSLLRQSELAAASQFESLGQKYITDLPESLRVVADEECLQTVILHLLDNASRYSPESGMIRTSLAVTTPRESGEEAEGVILRVSDPGCGIEPGAEAELFAPFVRKDSSYAHSGSGFGLGLTVVKRLVELHGGRVSVHSDGPGLGSEFTVRLPIAAPPARAN